MSEFPSLEGKGGYVDSWQIRDAKDVHPSHITKVYEESDVVECCIGKQELSRKIRKIRIKMINKYYGKQQIYDDLTKWENELLEAELKEFERRSL